jgi:hypothetical protein
MSRVTLQFVCRGPGNPEARDERLLALVPPGDSISIRRLESLATDLYLCECSPWYWANIGDGMWPVLRYYGEAARRDVEDAIGRQVLTLSTMVIERPSRDSMLERFCDLLRRILAHEDAPLAVPPNQISAKK